MQVVSKLTSLGIPVRALVNKKSKGTFQTNSLITILEGDEADEESVQSCMNGCVAAIAMVNCRSDGDGSAKLTS